VLAVDRGLRRFSNAASGKIEGAGVRENCMDVLHTSASVRYLVDRVGKTRAVCR
jgi:hypothetical protein